MLSKGSCYFEKKDKKSAVKKNVFFAFPSVVLLLNYPVIFFLFCISHPSKQAMRRTVVLGAALVIMPAFVISHLSFIIFPTIFIHKNRAE
jgi:hypothetical protein